MMTPFCNMSDETRIFDLYALLTVGSVIGVLDKQGALNDKEDGGNILQYFKPCPG